MRPIRLALALLLACVPSFLLIDAAHAQVAPIKPRISVLVDTSGSMLNTPQIITFPESINPATRTASCSTLGFNGCTGSGSLTAAQRQCNACVDWTINRIASCATNWTATCRATYQNCWQALTGAATGCGQNMNISDGILTRGDGTLETPGCDLNGDGLPNDSRIYQAKQAVSNVVATFGEVEFSLWRYKGEDAGQTCTTNATCPKTPGGLTVFSCDNINGTNRCDLNAVNQDVSTATAGQCNLNTWTGAANTFSCSQCDGASGENVYCNAWHLDQDKTGATTLFPGSTATVNCALPSTSHPYYKYLGAIHNGGTCDPDAGERLVDFPATGLDDNYNQLIQWMDNDGTETIFGADPELKAAGSTPIAGSLKSMLPTLQTTIAADSKAACRPYKAIIVTDGGENCETVANAKTAAAALFNNATKIPVYIIGLAICPGGGTTCQTAQDLNGIAAAGGTTSAFFVNDELSLQATLAQIVQSSVLTEKCNGLDDNCNGLVDEDFPGKGSACSVGVGQCLRNGTLVCTADQLGLQCSATPGTPTAEICNGLDDDCNGLVDDGINCTACVPSCAPSAGCDICNGKDDDCDGKIDEDFSSTSCGLNVGTCTPGTTTCTNGVIACAGGQGPTPEVCDGKDNNCDGIVDGMTTACYPPATVGCNPSTGVCQGICKLGTATCNNFPQTPVCVGAVTPVAEIACNGLDDDCDGLVDEGKGPEICDGLDNDCDGSIDEDVATTDPGIGVSCGTGPFVGQCAPGTVQCIAGAKQCVGAVGPGPEVCDGIDNNCNGQTDENVPGFGGACGSSVGTCKPGTLQCQGGTAVCVGGTGPTAEVCDGLDNNCNGLVDETDPNLGMTCNTLPGGGTVTTQTGACKFGVLACAAGALTCVGAIGPTAEKCNRIDDDCDGTVDEDFPQLGMTCDNGMQGVCKQSGVYVCAANGGGVVCTAPAGTPGTETCNGLDDDCDGQVDELPMPVVGTVCAPANGLCAPGLWECQAGALVCGAPSSGQTEICNGKDDDCDSLIDEEPVPGEGNNCTDPGYETIGDTGECTFGKTKCLNGAIGCDGYVGPKPEICDGKDNDCDGIVDEDAACPNGNVCNAGECVGPCGAGEFPCAAGYECKDLTNVTPPGQYCVKDPCTGVTCTGDQICDHNTGMCKDLCMGVSCPSGEVCRQGFCLDCFHLPDLCMPGQLCVADSTGTGQCQNNPCDPNPCMAGQICTNGTCSDGCGAGCPDGNVCVAGACQPDMCATVTCNSGQVCDPSNGKCTDPKCQGIDCHPGEVCVPTSGTCEPNPCTVTVCPTGLTCEVDPGGRAVCASPPVPKHERVTAAGGGCAAGGDGAAPWLLGALLLPALRRRRRGAAASRRAGGGAA